MRPHLLNLIVLSIACVTLALGCNRNPCKRVECGPGTCVEGECQCPQGLEGASCGIVVLDKFLGGFDLEEACTAGSDAYPVDIKRWGTSNLELAIVGLWEQQDSLRATIHEDGTTFEILRQTIGGQDILGNGEINVNGDEINLEYEVISTTASSPFDHCTATLKKL